MAAPEQEPGTEFSPLLSNMKRIKRIHGMIYQNWNYGLPYEEILRRMKALEIRQDDVICTGYPRSGNNWMFDVVHMIRRQTTEYSKHHLFTSVIDARLPTPGDVENEPSPRTLFTHCRAYSLPEQIIEKKTKIIYIIRNPKDVMVSLFMLYKRIKDKDGVFTGTWDQFFDLMLQGEFPFGTWCSHVLAMEKFMAENPEVPVFTLVFEEMKVNPVETIRKMCQFFEMPDDLAQDIARVTQFEAMRKSVTKNNAIEDSFFISKDDPTLLRKGLVGDWQNVFTVAQNERFDQYFKETMAGSTLAARVKKYIL